MKDGFVSIEVPKSKSSTESKTPDVLDWRRSSMIHIAWEEESKKSIISIIKRKMLHFLDSSSQSDVNYKLERHHSYNGRPWCLGRDHIDYLVRRGLQPHHAFLDLGCGAMRTGIWVAKFLDSGRYFGIDAHRPGLAAAANYEVPLHGLQSKAPRLLNDDQFDIGHFQVKFDWVFAFALVNHLPDDFFDLAFRRIRKYMKPDGRLVISPEPRGRLGLIEGTHGFELTHHEKAPCLLIDDTIDWFEFKKRADPNSR